MTNFDSLIVKQLRINNRINSLITGLKHYQNNSLIKTEFCSR